MSLVRASPSELKRVKYDQIAAAAAKCNPARWAFPVAFIHSIVPINLKKKNHSGKRPAQLKRKWSMLYARVRMVLKPHLKVAR